MYIKNKIGFGLSYRYHESLSGIISLRTKIVTLGFAYDIIISKIRNGAASSRETMIGTSNCPSGLSEGAKTGCPAYDF